MTTLLRLLALLLILTMVGKSDASMLMKGVGSPDIVLGTPCNNGQLDFSVTTGCNTTFFMIGL